MPDLVNLTEAVGSIIEIGYLRNSSKHKVDRVHGDWYKRFDFGNKHLYINETNYTSQAIKTENGKKQIKSTYRKELFSE
ncbi:MAG TPA: hypothetical protein PKA42_00050 [Candidatus Paceibacterota bacterium]|nr:hypothetical protein [Candidatus Paceibacterota bacterium]HMO82539.1 hypothetical protein [Candidatus Paceibacterota bacterium]